MEKKMTYSVAIDNALAVVVDEETRARLVDLKESLAKRNARKSDKPTKAQREKAEFAETVIGAMVVGEKYQCKTLAEKLDTTPQKISGAFAYALQDRVVKSTEKGITYYSIAE